MISACSSSMERVGSCMAGRSGQRLRNAGLDGIGRIGAPLVPAAVVYGDARPAEQPGVEEGLAATPAGAAVEGVVLVGRDAGRLPRGRDLAVLPAGVVQ